VQTSARTRGRGNHRETHRASVALRSNPTQGPGVGRNVAGRAAPALDGRARPARGRDRRKNPQGQQIMTADTVTEDTVTEATVLRLERLIPAPPENVFDAWTEPQILAQWWGPEGFTTPSPQVDLRVGGSYRTVMIAADGGEFIATGTYRGIERPRRLIFTWAWEKEGARGHET